MDRTEATIAAIQQGNWEGDSWVPCVIRNIDVSVSTPSSQKWVPNACPAATPKPSGRWDAPFQAFREEGVVCMNYGMTLPV